MILRIEADSPTPPYEQIRQQLSVMIASGVLSEGTRLPTIRQLSRDLGLASGTVARAYRELENVGAITTKGRQGTFVAKVRKTHKTDHAPLLEEAARDMALRAFQLGADEERTLDAVRQAFAAVKPG